MKVFHHNDFDGRCAAAIVYKMICEKGMGIDFDNFGLPRFIEIDYKDQYDVSQIGFCEAVIIVDFSFKPEVMNEILKKTTNVTWIDHHKTAEAYRDQYAQLLSGVRDFSTPGESGCELTWRYFFPEQEMPRAVKLIGDFDTWRWEFKDETAEFCEGLRVEDLSHTSAFWKGLLWTQEENPATMVTYCATERYLNNMQRIRDNGRICMRYRDKFCTDYCDTYGFETEFEGYKCFALNLYKFGSLTFGTLMKVYDICITFAFDGTKYTVGLYTVKDGLDVSAIAKQHGGGGHLQAAGFVTKTLPFKAEPR